MWVCKMTKVTPSPQGFAYAHRVHKQPRIVTGVSGSSSEEVKYEGHFSCRNFVYKPDVLAPITTYRNKWTKDWWIEWFYYTKEGDANGIVSRPLEFFVEPITAHEDENPDGEAYVVMLCEITKTYTV